MESNQSIVFKSAYSKAIVIPLGIALVSVGALLLWQKVWPGFGFILFLIIFVVRLLRGIRYTVTETQLIVKTGIGRGQEIQISDIRKIEETHNPMSSPAGSLDRLEVFYGKYDSVLISPKEKEAFIALMLERNPTIEVNRKP